MGEIAYPLRRRMRGRQVAELQLTLGALLDAGAVGGKASEELRGPLEAERKRSAFGPTTERMVTLFQQRLGEEHELTISGEVAATACVSASGR